MKRRDFLLLAAGTAMASKPALAARGIPHIGVMGPGSREASQDLLDTLRDGLGTFGWVDGGNLALLERWAEERTEKLWGATRVISPSALR
jgi:hypothetical protein